MDIIPIVESLLKCKRCGEFPLVYYHHAAFGMRAGYFVECFDHKYVKKLGPFSSQEVAIRIWNNEEGQK